MLNQFNNTQDFFIKISLILSILILICIIICQNLIILPEVSNLLLQRLVIYILIFSALVFIYMKLSSKTDFENFVDKIEEEKKNYIPILLQKLIPG